MDNANGSTATDMLTEKYPINVPTISIRPVRKAIKDYSFARFGKKQTEVQIANLGNDAGIIGAALLWKNE